MSVLSWGKCKIQTTPSVDGAPGASAEWKDIDTPKEDTTQLTTTQGDKVEATEEGGAVVDTRYKANTAELAFDLFVKKGGTAPFTDTDGAVSGEHAFRVIPEDKDCQGIQIDRGSVNVQIAYTAADGITLHHVVSVMKPKTGNMVKLYTATSGA